MRWLPKGLMLLVVSACIPVVARGDLIDPVATLNIRDDQAGAEVTNPGGSYSAVGRMTTPSFTASGTLIGENWVLTAAHVVGSGAASQYSFDIGGQNYMAAEIIREPTWSGSLYAGNDIALVRLTTSVTNVVPAALFDGSLSELGQIDTLVGFGSRGTGSEPGTIAGGIRHFGRNLIDVTGDMVDQGTEPAYDERILFSDFDDPADPAESLFGSPLPIDLESNVAGGDSGGALFVNFGHGDLLAGVISFLGHDDGTADGDYGDVSGFISVADYLDFIEAESGIAPASVPEPSSWLLLGIVFAGAVAKRWRTGSP